MHKWLNDSDKTKPIITATEHIHSSHGNYTGTTLPQTCVLFEIGVAISHIESNYNTHTLIEKMPCFLENPKCICVDNINNVCFVRGGYGAPAAVDALETLIALGVKQIIVVGMCGVFVNNINVGDVIIPLHIQREEGTSYHYIESGRYSKPDPHLFKKAYDYFKAAAAIHNNTTVSTDAVYRQTFYKEQIWRNQGIVGVDMEASALLAVSEYYNIPAVAILLASDKHPQTENEMKWEWGNASFNKAKRDFIDKCVGFAGSLT